MHHEIERLVESSVRAMAASAANILLGREICFHLYELQKQFHCGYTILRVSEELEKLGYLFPLPLKKLPEPERTQAKKLWEDGGFLPDGTFLDCNTGLAYVTAGSILWKKLCYLEILHSHGSMDIRKMYPVELAETILPLASQALACGNAWGVQALGLWYALFPLLCETCGYDEENPPAPKQIQRLLNQMAVPEAFSYAQPYLEEFFDIKFKLPFLSNWAEPYLKWQTQQLQAQQAVERIHTLVEEEEFHQADTLACQLPEGFARTFYRCFVSMRYFQEARQKTRPPEMLSLESASNGLAALLTQSLEPRQELFCRAYLSCCQLLLEDGQAASEEGPQKTPSGKEDPDMELENAPDSHKAQEILRQLMLSSDLKNKQPSIP